MIAAFDSSVLVAGLFEGHPWHRRAAVFLDACARGERQGIASHHALAETWSVLTRLPVTPAPTPEQARRVVSRIGDVLRLVAPTAEVYDLAIERCASRGLRSGAVFDAIHIVTAERAGADEILTFNPRDFVRLAEPKSPEVVVPPELPGSA